MEDGEIAKFTTLEQSRRLKSVWFIKTSQFVWCSDKDGVFIDYCSWPTSPLPSRNLNESSFEEYAYSISDLIDSLPISYALARSYEPVWVREWICGDLVDHAQEDEWHLLPFSNAHSFGETPIQALADIIIRLLTNKRKLGGN